ncbi:hypothetical protein Zmor_003516 [Zophobas morio]|uniref:Uncharacterized protein n=1 Tax=Zophobas morio TaxID=2755281 RepID=A0AA38HPH3_9CUCU|nr:hypothetical protein Zmor_003516 [Zophobas morio]
MTLQNLPNVVLSMVYQKSDRYFLIAYVVSATLRDRRGDTVTSAKWQEKDDIIIGSLSARMWPVFSPRWHLNRLLCTEAVDTFRYNGDVVRQCARSQRNQSCEKINQNPGSLRLICMPTGKMFINGSKTSSNPSSNHLPIPLCVQFKHKYVPMSSASRSGTYSFDAT